MQNKAILSLLAVAVLASLVAPTHQKTECQRKRDDAERQIQRQERNKDFGVAILVPKCDSNGDYESLQCHHNSPFCQCWSKDGSPVTQAKKNLSRCSCFLEQAAHRRSIAPSAAGSSPLLGCKPDGTYEEKQCNRSGCWCVHPETGKKRSSGSKC